MTAEEAVVIFEVAARPFLDQFATNTCIEQSRILIEVLKRLGISAEPKATKLHVIVPSRDFQFFASGDPADLEQAKKLPKGTVISKKNSSDETLGYHTVVVVENRIFVDLTLAQASNEQFSFRLDPCMVWFDLKREFDSPFFDIQVEATGDDGTPFSVRWIGTDNRDFESTPAWEPSHLWPLIDMIEAGAWNEWLARRKAG